MVAFYLRYQSWRLYVLAVFCGCMLSCTFSRLRKDPDWRVKYDAALVYYDKGKYGHAELLLEDVIPLIRGTKKGEIGEYRYAYALYYGKKYILSAYHFNTFADTYNSSEYIEDARYRHADALYLSTLDYQLDPSPTYEALSAMQLYIELYPSSKRRKTAQTVIDTLQYDLESKAFYNARLYARLGYYKAAVYVLDQFQNTFPVSRYIARSWRLKIESQHALASRSVPQKKRARYKKLLKMYEEFIDLYPQHVYVKDLSSFYEEGLDFIRVEQKE